MPSLFSRYAVLVGFLSLPCLSAATVTPTRSPQFSADSLYHLLLAEIALQRGQTQFALNEYYQQSKSTQDNGVIERAMQIANYLQNSEIGLPLAEQWVSSDNKSAKAYYQLAYHALKKQKYEQAMKAIDQLLILEPEAQLETLFLTAYPAQVSARKELLTALTQLEKTFPDNANLLFAHGLLEGENGNYALALNYLEQAYAKKKSIPIVLLEARLLTLNKQEKKALQVLAEALTLYPTSQQLNLHYIRALIANRDYLSAETKLANLLVSMPDNTEILLMHALLAYDNKHDDAASDSLNKLIGLESNQDEAYYYLAQIAKRKKQISAAENYLSHINEGDRFLTAQVELATLRIHDNRLNQARQQFAEARQHHPDLANTLYALEAEVLNDNKQTELAYALLADAINKFPQDNLLLFSRALMAERLNNLVQFETDMQELLRRDPQNPSYMNAYGYTLADKTNRLAEAEPYLRQAIKLKPNDPAIIDSVGWLLYKQGRLFEALSYIRKAFQASADEEIGLHLAEILWVSGYKAEAQQVWQKLLQKKPNSEPVLKHRAQWEK
ncbi:tetratricopeptide repeat protein [Agitococcus lubricus]|uniref:Flp pilus assembly protein TadD n=1 Tax=Agitococcus lubricus TaxID=1077255 RepID=A0A2T5ITT7_9GAMM|nr:tetratricopeptide repeat protein [Agitococcus lubricus]PTQ87221.1 Flp pilus assembly protein TadD [Agitococcus lubricus]